MKIRISPSHFYWFIVLLGLLPAIKDFSLYALLGLPASQLNWSYYLAMATLPLGLAVIFFTKNRSRIIGILPAISIVLIFLLSGLGGHFGTFSWLQRLLFFGSVKIAFVYFLTRGKSHLPILVFFSIFLLFSLGFTKALLFFCITYLLQFALKLFTQINEIRQEWSTVELRQLTFKSILQASPILLFVIAGFLITNQFHRSSIDRVYQRTFVEIDSTLLHLNHRDQFTTSLRPSVFAGIDQINEQFVNVQPPLKKAIEQLGKDNYLEEALVLFDACFPADFSGIIPSFEIQPCDNWGISCALKNSLKSAMNTSYLKELERAKKRLEGNLQKLPSTMMSQDSLSRAIMAQYEAQLYPFEEGLVNGLGTLYDTLFSINLLIKALLLFAAIFSFFYFFKRLATPTLTTDPSPTQTPILSRWLDSIYFFVVLIGLLPVVENYSLFAVFGFPILDLTWHNEAVSTNQWLYLIALGLLPLGLFTILYSKRSDRLLGLLPGLITAGSLILVITLFDGLIQQGFFLGLLHFIVYKIAFLYFIVRGKIRSWPFGAALCIIGVWFGFFPLIIFLTYTILVKLVYLALVQNFSVFKNMDWQKGFQLTFKSILFWLPLLLFIIPSAFLSNRLYHSGIDSIYDNTFIKPDSSLVHRKYDRDQFERNLIQSLDTLLTEKEDSLNLAIGQLDASIVENTQNLETEVDKLFEEVVPTVSAMAQGVLKQEKCKIGLGYPTCEGINCAKANAIISFSSWRKSAKQKLKSRVNRKVEDLEQEVSNKKESLQVVVSEQFLAIKTDTQNAFQFLFDAFFFLNLLMDILFGFVILKSFLYVFARVAFSANEKNYVTLMDSEADMPNGQLTKYQNQYIIPPSEPTSYLISRKYEPSGHAPKFVLPQWGAAILARITTRNYAMNKVSMDQNSDQVIFRSMGGKEFVEWDLAEGEVVIFNFANFVGMSEEIKLEAIISLRLTSLLMGRLIFTSARGPGKLILQTNGNPITGADQKGRISVPTSRILAWQKNTHFNVESELSLVDVFLSGIYLKKQEDDLVLIDADVKGRSKNGIVKFIRVFLLPI